MRIVTVLVLLAAALFTVVPAHADWAPLGSGMIGGAYPYVYAVLVFNGSLYAAGSFNTAGGVQASNIARWDGTSWSGLGSGTNGAVYTLCVYNNRMLVGGQFSLAGGLNVTNIAAYDGVNWTSIGNALTGSVYKIFYAGSLTPDQLYIAGPSPSGVWSYHNGTWRAVGLGLPNDVFTLSTYNNQLCAGGDFPNGIKVFDGTNWQDMAGGVNGIAYAISQLQSGPLVVGGLFNTAGGQQASNIAEFDSGHWAQVGPGVDSYVLGVSQPDPYGSLYDVGGDFTHAGSTTVNHAAQWNGTEFVPLGSGTNLDVTAMTPVDPPLTAGTTLIACGYFTLAGGQTANRIARWTNTSGVSDFAGASAGGARVFPSPTAGACQVAYRVPAAGPVTIDIVDVTGRIVRRLLDGTRPAGSYSLTWSATDDAGRQVAPGVYLARVATGGEESAAKVILTR